MGAKFTPKETLRVIDKEGLLREVMAMKSRNMRLSQACATYKDGKYELSYSFADDETMDYETLRVIVGLAEEVPSIHNFYSCASYYENEMRELFGVKIELIDPDYHNKFYRIKAEKPFLPEDAKAQQEKEEREISLNGADSKLVQAQEAVDEKAAEQKAADEAEDGMPGAGKAAEKAAEKASGVTPAAKKGVQ